MKLWYKCKVIVTWTRDSGHSSRPTLLHSTHPAAVQVMVYRMGFLPDLPRYPSSRLALAPRGSIADWTNSRFVLPAWVLLDGCWTVISTERMEGMPRLTIAEADGRRLLCPQ
jgi:hypothetical protein